ncbi:MAG: polymer-forming cytoskeletal protein [Polyangiales bacterium]
MANETTIRVGTTIDGDLRGDEDVVVEGRVHGSIDVAGRVTLARTGVVRGDVRGRIVVIAGVLVGSVEAADAIDVLGSARVVGDLVAPSITVAETATFHGRADQAASVPDATESMTPPPVLSAEDTSRDRPGLRRAPVPSFPLLRRATGRRRAMP